MLSLARNKDMANDTKEAYCRDVRIFITYLVSENKDVKTCTASDSDLFFKNYEQTHLDRSSARVRSSLRDFFDCPEIVLIRHDIPYIPQKSYEKSQPRELAHEDIEELLKCPYSSKYTERDLAIISTLANTGLKASQLLTLKVEQLDLKRSSLVNVGKSHRTINILNDSTTGYLRSYLESREEISNLNTHALFVFPHRRCQLTRPGLDHILKSWAEYHNIPLVSAKDFRHSYGRHLYQSGYSLEYIQQSLGLKHLKNARIYEQHTTNS